MPIITHLDLGAAGGAAMPPIEAGLDHARAAFLQHHRQPAGVPA